MLYKTAWKHPQKKKHSTLPVPSLQANCKRNTESLQECPALECSPFMAPNHGERDKGPPNHGEHGEGQTRVQLALIRWSPAALRGLGMPSSLLACLSWRQKSREERKEKEVIHLFMNLPMWQLLIGATWTWGRRCCCWPGGTTLWQRIRLVSFYLPLRTHHLPSSVSPKTEPCGLYQQVLLPSAFWLVQFMGHLAKKQ